MKTISIFIIMIALLIVGCNQDNPTDIVSTTSNDAPAQFNKNVPFVARGTVQVTTGVPSTACNTYPYPYSYLSGVTGSGNATHLGYITVESSHCFDLPDLLAYNSEATMTGDNGDKIFFTYTFKLLPLDPSMINFSYTEGKFTILGGTGKFVGATGSGIVTGSYNGDTKFGKLNMDGRIIYK